MSILTITIDYLLITITISANTDAHILLPNTGCWLCVNVVNSKYVPQIHEYSISAKVHCLHMYTSCWPSMEVYFKEHFA